MRLSANTPNELATALGPDGPERGAVLSDCSRYRYLLWRRWGGGDSVLFVGLNPSTADAQADDPTIRRCVAFATAWGFSSVVMANLFAWRATDPRHLITAPDPVGAENDDWLRACSSQCALTVAAWGTGGRYMGRGESVRGMLVKPHCLRLTRNGLPAHPLYLPGVLKPIPWCK